MGRGERGPRYAAVEISRVISVIENTGKGCQIYARQLDEAIFSILPNQSDMSL